jgi:hypothetical protein
MAAIAKIYITADMLKKMVEDSQGRGLSVSVKINDTITETGKNVFMQRSKTKDEIDSKAHDVTYGYGHCVFSKGECLENKPVWNAETKSYEVQTGTVPTSQTVDPKVPVEVAQDDSDLPF